MRETRTLEFKESVSNSFLKTVSAFSNYEGGTILFGVDDDGKAVGLSDPKAACLDIENKINDSISPQPSYRLDINEKNSVVSLKVEAGKRKPYFYKSAAYRRNDSSTVTVDRDELARLILEGQNKSFDELEADSQDLSFALLGEKLSSAIMLETFSRDTLRTLGLMDKNGRFNNAAALLADDNDFYGIDIARFGESEDYILDREGFMKMSVLRQYDLAVEMYKKYYQYERIRGIRRETIEMIPEKAFREAVANALVHRLWDIKANIRISMHPGKIEVVSPGGLPSGVSESDYLSGNVSVLRNPILGDVFFRLKYIERFGTGVRRIKEAYAESARKPDFFITENAIGVSLPLIEDEALSENERAIYSLMQGGRMVSSSDISETLGFGKSKTIGLLKRLEEGGYIEKTGVGRSTRYRRL